MHAFQPANLALPYITLTAHPAIGALLLDKRPVWVWNSEGTRVLWSNAAGLAFFGETSMEALMNRSFGDVHPARRHLARLGRVAHLNTPLLDRLRFFVGETATTAACLCKRLDVEGEPVLLVIATDQDGYGETDFYRGEQLVKAIGNASDMRAALFDHHGKVICSSQTFEAAANAPSLAKAMINAVKDDDRLRVHTAAIGDVDCLASLVQIGEAPWCRHLMILHNPAGELGREEAIALIEAMDVDADDLSDHEAMLQAGDIFDDTFGLEPIEHHGASSADLQKDSDFQPFLSDISEHVTQASSEQPVQEDDATRVEEASNVVRVPFGAARSAKPKDLSVVPTISGKDDTPSPDMQGTAPLDFEESSSSAPIDSDFTFDGTSGPHHFVWESDAVGRFTFVSPDLAQAVGPLPADILGRTWAEVASRLQMDGDGAVAQGFESKDTWVGLTVLWPVQGFDLRIPVEMTGLPVFGRYHGFQGFRGFGVCDTGKAQPSIPFDMDRSDNSLPSAGASDHAERIGTEFDHNSELVSEALMQAAREAVRATTDAISPGQHQDTSEQPNETEPQTPEEWGIQAVDGVDAVSDCDDDQTQTVDDGDSESDLLSTDRLDTPQAEDSAEPERSSKPKIPAYDPYHLVISLLNGTASGVTEHTKPPASDEATPSQIEGSSSSKSKSLSEGEKAAFDSIAKTLSSTPDDEDIDDDYQEFEAILIEEEACETSEEEGSEPNAAADHSEMPVEQETSLLPDEAPAATVASDEVHPEGAPQEGAKASQKPKLDHALRSAASSAFRDILAMDPAFRHMRGHMAELSGISNEDEPKKSAAASELPPRDEPQASPSNPVESETEMVASEGEIAGQEPDAEDRIPSEPLEDEAIQEDARDTILAASNDTDDTKDGSAQALAAAAVAGVAALGGTSLWDRTDASSPLIDLLNKIPTAIVVSADGQILFASRAALRQLGFEHASDLDEAGGMERLFTGRPGDWLTKTDGRTTLRSATGAPISVLANISSINWGDRPAAMLSFEKAPDTPPGLGISEEDEKIAELEAILDTATDGVIVLNADGEILRMNHSAEALFEVDRHLAAGSSFLDLLAEESHKDVLDYLHSLKQNGVASVLNDGRDIIGRVQSGGFIPLFMTMGRIAIPGTNRYCAVLRDDTHSKKAQEDLLAQKVSAESASHQKSEFLAKVSHEIRTPLNAIIGFSEIMMEERLGPIGSERYKDYLRDISASGKHIMSLVNDLLDLSKVEAGKLDMHFEATQLNQIVAESVGIMQQQANREQIIIRTSLSSKLPQLAGDARSLRQIILNVLSNALKFTPAGGQVIVSTLCEDNGDVGLRIRDTGIGMSKEDISTALEPFRQVSSIRGSAEGSGLGLPLTKALVEANRGRLSISSEKGHGTLIEITFPKERVIEDEEEDVDTPA